MNDNSRKNLGEPDNISEDDEIIDLTRVVKPVRDDDIDDQPVDEVELLPVEDDESDDFDEDDMDLGQLVADVVGGDASESGLTPSEYVTIPVKHLEEGLEKVLRKAYSDKIEVMVMDMVEKTLKAEIEKINALVWKIAHDSEEES